LIKGVQLGDLLAIAIDPKLQAALVLRSSGAMDHFSYPDFHLRGRYMLQQPGYRAVLDGQAGRLYVAASESAALNVNNYADRPVGRGDLHIYDVRSLVGHSAEANAASTIGMGMAAQAPGSLLAASMHIAVQSARGLLKPQAAVPHGGYISHLEFDPNRQTIYYLLHLPTEDRIARIAPARLARAQTVQVEGPLEAICLDPHGNSVYAGGPGKVLVLEPESLRQRAGYALNSSVCEMSADNLGRLFVGEQGQWPEVTVLDAAHGTILKQWDSLLPGHNYLAVTPDGGRIYLGSSGRITGMLRSLRVLHLGTAYPSAAAYANSGTSSIQRGEFFLSPDTRYLITRNGRVFRLAPPESQQRPGKLHRLVGESFEPS
jgi:hypothetical protein